jgi:hypothetical protein
MRRRVPQWSDLDATGRAGRALATVFGTALLLAPFVGIGWLILR